MRRLGSLLVATTMLGTVACGGDRPATAPDAARGTRLETPADEPTPDAIELVKIGGYAGGGPAAAEITAFDARSQRLFVVNGALGTVDVLDLRDPAAPVKVATIDVGDIGGAANSVATHDGLVAVAVEADVKTQPGTVAFYRAETLELVSTAAVGALPDMLTFTRSGRQVLVANEGEPSDDYAVDPEGSVSIIDVRDERAPSVRTVGFTRFDADADWLRAHGVRIYGPNARASQDFEPEYIAVSDDERTAWVTLQENNAIAIVDVKGGYVRKVMPLGYKNHRLAGNGFDASDRDGPAVNIREWPVLGMYQPDAIAAVTARGRTWLLTANEGDARDWAGLREEARVSTLPLNPASFPDAACGGPCNAAARLGRLTVTNQHGRNAVTGLFDTLYVLGGRSFSVRDDAGALVWDSGDELERRTAALPNVAFNASNNNNALDDRSDNKGPEPEGIAVGRMGRKTFAFIGLERVGGVMVYDVTSPWAPRFVSYANTRQGTTGDLGPEGVTFVPARESPSKRPLVIVGNEVSGTTAIYEVVAK